MRSRTAIRMLLHDRTTTAGAVAGVIAIVFLVGQQLSIFFGLLNFMSVLVDMSGADLWVLSKNADNVNATSSLPVRYLDRIIGLEGVAWAEPVVRTAGMLRTPAGENQPVQVVGLRRPRLAGGPWRWEHGSAASLLDDEAISIDRLDAKALGDPQLGDTIEINGKKTILRATTLNVRGFQGTLVFTNAAKAREIGQIGPDRCSHILIKAAPGVDVGRLQAELQRVLRQTEVYTTARLSTLTKLYYVRNTGIGGSFGFTTLVGALVGVVIIALTMYTNVLGKLREFAVLRALGARRWDVLVVVLVQALAIAFVGSLIGFGLLAVFLNSVSDTALPSYMPAWVPPLHAAFTFLLCLLGSVAAMRRAIRVEPASAFR